MLNFTKFRIYTIGIVAKDKEDNSKEITVYPIEVLPNVDGNITEEKDIDISTKDVSDNNITIKIKKHNTIIAEWLGMGDSNRISAPDVCKGEYVVLYRYSGNDLFYWDTFTIEPDLRKKEKVVYFFSNKEEIQENDSDLLSKGYKAVIDTKNKHLGIHTTNNDNEKTTYDLQLDTAEGIAMLADGNNNGFILKSEDGDLEINLANDSKTTIGNKKEEEIGDEFKLKVGKDYKLDISSNMEIKCKKFSVSNGSSELLAILSDLIQALSEEKHIGNMGAPTMLDPGSMSKYLMLKTKLDMLKK